MKLAVFNPDCDLAMADFSENYMAPALIRQMEQDLALLPVWFAAPGSGVVAASAYNEGFLHGMQGCFDLPVQLVTWPELADWQGGEVCPWGWSPALRKRLLKAGVAEAVLPGWEELQGYRAWMGRNCALRVLQVFEGMKGCCGTGGELTSVEDCERYWRLHGGRCVFKAPWSGSGKGLLWCYSDFSVSVASWCRRILQTQGLLVGMPIYNKVCDFAMEFCMQREGAVRFAGYSLFTTNAKGAYQGNCLLSDEAIECALAAYVPTAWLQAIRLRLQSALQQYYKGYVGFLGVDMMVCLLEDGTYAVCPCVEVNLRMNMGWVSRIIYDRFLLPGTVGRFAVEAFMGREELMQAHDADTRDFPAVIEQGRLTRGYLPLVPVTPQSRYRAYVKVFPEKNEG